MAIKRETLVQMLNAITDFAAEFKKIYREMLSVLNKFKNQEKDDDEAQKVYYTTIKTVDGYAESTSKRAKAAHAAFLGFANKLFTGSQRIVSDSPSSIVAEDRTQPQKTDSRQISHADAAAWKECGEKLAPTAKKAKDRAEELYDVYNNLKDRLGGSDNENVKALRSSLKQICALQDAFYLAMRKLGESYEAQADYIKVLTNGGNPSGT